MNVPCEVEGLLYEIGEYVGGGGFGLSRFGVVGCE